MNWIDDFKQLMQRYPEIKRVVITSRHEYDERGSIEAESILVG